MSNSRLTRCLTEGKMSDRRFGWYETRRQPKRLEYDFPLYVAVDGKIRGYFGIHNCVLNDIEWKYTFFYYSESWGYIDGGHEGKH